METTEGTAASNSHFRLAPGKKQNKLGEWREESPALFKMFSSVLWVGSRGHIFEFNTSQPHVRYRPTICTLHYTGCSTVSNFAKILVLR